MHTTCNARRRIIRASSTSTQSCIWITDDLLQNAYSRFVRLPQCSRRHGSNTPGPLEAQRRLAKRRMGALTAFGSGFPPEIGSILPDGLPARDDIQWQCPGSRQTIDRTSKQVRSATKPSTLVGTFGEQFKAWYRNVIPEVLTLEEGLARVKSLQDLRDIREDLLRQGESLKDYNRLSFKALLSAEASLSDICAYLYDSSFNIPEAHNLSTLLDHLIRASSHRVSSQDFVDIACQLMKSKMTLPAEVLNIVQHVSLLSLDTKRIPAVYRDLWRSIRATYDESVIQPVARTMVERLDIETESMSSALEGEMWEAQHQDCFQLRLSLYQRLWPERKPFKAPNPEISKYILYWLRHRYMPVPRDASFIGLMQIARLLRHMSYQLLAETCNEVTARICRHHDSSSMLPRWLACIREACAANISSATIGEGTFFRDPRHVAFDQLMQQQYNFIGASYCFPSLRMHLTNSKLGDAEICRLIALNWRAPTDSSRSKDSRWQHMTSLTGPGSQFSGTASRRVLNAASKSLTKFLVYTPSGGFSVDVYIRLLKKMPRTQYGDSAGLVDFVVRIAAARHGTGAGLAVHIAAHEMGYRIRPSILRRLASKRLEESPRDVEQLLDQKRLSGRSASDILRILLKRHYVPPSVFWRSYSKKMNPNVRSYLSHMAAEKWSDSKTIPHRSAFKLVSTIYRQLRTRKIPILPALSRALVKSGLTRPLHQRKWVIDARIRWILSIVAQVEGEEVAAQIDQLVYVWRMRNAQEAREKKASGRSGAAASPPKVRMGVSHKVPSKYRRVELKPGDGSQRMIAWAPAVAVWL